MPGFVIFWISVVVFVGLVSLIARRRIRHRSLPHDLRNQGALDVHQHYTDPIAAASQGAWGGGGTYGHGG
jgi:hypothetical protein